MNYVSDKYQYIKQSELFSNQITPVQINLDFKINAGLNSGIMGANSSIIFDTKEITYSSIEEISVVQELIDKLSTLSKGGNLLASELYDKIYNKLEIFTNEITIQIKSLNDLLMYYDMHKVFNSTLLEYSFKKLPSETLEISNQLINALSSIYYNIKTGNVKYHLDTLSDDVYSFIDELHDLITKMLNNFKTLNNILITKNNTFTEITNYYLNNTSSSYVNLIGKIKTVMDTFFIKEYEEILPKIQQLINSIELNTNDTLKDELNSLKTLYNNIKENNFTINSITEVQRQTILSNLENSYNYPTDIIHKLNEHINDIIKLKENGYLISNEDINNFNSSFNNIITEAKDVAKILDNVTIIDKVFDDIMIKFREGYIYTVKFMEEIKSGNFTLEEDVLNTSLFSKNEKNVIENDLKTLSDNVLDIIKKEKDLYVLNIKNHFQKFLDDNLDDLNDIIYYLNVLLSEEEISNIAKYFEISLNSSLEKLMNIIKDNVKLTKQYFDQYDKMINNDTELLILLSNYKIEHSTIFNPYYAPYYNIDFVINSHNASFQYKSTDKIEKNGKYVFKIMRKDGQVIEEVVEINNIDQQKPTGSCINTITNGKSEITVTANDENGIKGYDYIVNGKVQKSTNEAVYQYNKLTSNAKVVVYDEVGNDLEISCPVTYNVDQWPKDKTRDMISTNNNYY